MSDDLQRMDEIIMELMKADKYTELHNRVKTICKKLETEEVLFLLCVLRNPLLSPRIRLTMLEYVIS